MLSPGMSNLEYTGVLRAVYNASELRNRLGSRKTWLIDEQLLITCRLQVTSYQ